jgi:DNA-binding PadR family transcriptional regulator
MSGYDLALVVRTSVGHIWSESYGQIYPTLRKLAVRGLVNRKTERHRSKPDRHVYSITTKGRKELTAWLAVPPQPEIPRNEMLLKLFLGAQASIDVLVANVERMVQEHGALLQKFKRIEHDEIDKNLQYPDAPFWKMTARYGQTEMEAHLKWAEETLEALRKIAKQQNSSLEARKEKNYARG